ncbi:MAG TPA: PilZ domain-containing protein [Spirochaetes bacterium]|nr:PilZ domain-containing protein [Spirochaetota bacterium]
MEDRREYIRLNESIAIKYTIIYSIGFGSNITEGEGSALSINVSEGGLLFLSDMELPVKTFLEVELNLKGEELPVYLKGEVIDISKLPSNDQYKVRMQFEYKYEQDSKLLHQHVLENTLKP